MGQATDENMAHAHYMLNTKDYKHALRIYNTYCFPLQQWLHERSLRLRYTYTVYLVKTFFVGRLYRKGPGLWHTDVIAQYLWPYKTWINITSGPALQHILSALYHATMNLKCILFLLMYTSAVWLHQFLVPTQRQSLNVDYSLSFLNNRRGKAGIFPLYGIRRLGNTGLIEGNGKWTLTMATASRHLNWMPVFPPIECQYLHQFFRNLNEIIEDITLRYSK